MSNESGWISVGPEGPAPDLSADVRESLLERMAVRRARLGQLQAIVQVQVCENGECIPQVSFTPECALGPDTPPGRIARLVQAAQDSLTSWR